MCDYSLHSVKSRPAEVGDKLTTHEGSAKLFGKPLGEIYTRVATAATQTPLMVLERQFV